MDTDSLCVRLWQHPLCQGIKHMGEWTQLREQLIHIGKYILHVETLLVFNSSVLKR